MRNRFKNIRQKAQDDIESALEREMSEAEAISEIQAASAELAEQEHVEAPVTYREPKPRRARAEPITPSMPEPSVEDPGDGVQMPEEEKATDEAPAPEPLEFREVAAAPEPAEAPAAMQEREPEPETDDAGEEAPAAPDVPPSRPVSADTDELSVLADTIAQLRREEEAEKQQQIEGDLSLNEEKGVSDAERGKTPGTAKKLRTFLSKREVFLKEKDVDGVLWELELALLESDVALPVIETIKDNLKQELLAHSISAGTDIGDYIEHALKKAMVSVLTKPFDFDEYVKNAEKPAIIMFVGINGTGKTTTIARIAKRLSSQGYSCVISASDTFRAGAIEQIGIHADNLGIKLIKHKAGSDPAAVAYDAVEHARARGKSVVLIDTAGRIQTNTNLMDEMKKIKRIAQPDLIVFVGDSLAGNDAVDQAEKFNDAVGIDGVVLTKIDADAKGGSALSIAHTIGKPILFLGVGQEYGDLQKFDPDWMIARLFEGAAA